MIRLLGESDTAVLAQIARDAPDFDIAGRTETLQSVDYSPARAYLSNPDILHWAAEENGRVIGFLHCYVLRLWHSPGLELMLYDIGIRASHRRRGVGRALVATMESWMADNGIADVWVPADNPGAEAFYRACGFDRDEEQAVMLSKQVRQDDTLGSQR